MPHRTVRLVSSVCAAALSDGLLMALSYILLILFRWYICIMYDKCVCFQLHWFMAVLWTIFSLEPESLHVCEKKRNRWSFLCLDLFLARVQEITVNCTFPVYTTMFLSKTAAFLHFGCLCTQEQRLVSLKTKHFEFRSQRKHRCEITHAHEAQPQSRAFLCLLK